MNSLYRFFCWAGGGNTTILEEMHTERNRFLAYGTVICMTAVFAFLSSLYAFSLLLKEQIGYWVIVPALAWATFIFVLDRFFIVTISTRGATGQKLLMALPRLMLAVFIGIIISKPLEYRIFEREIHDQLRLTRSAEIQKLDSLQRTYTTRNDADRDTAISKLPQWKQIQPLANQQKELKDQQVTVKKEIANRQDSILYELAGKGITNKIGPGPATRLHERIRDSLMIVDGRLTGNISSLQSRIDTIRSQLDDQVKNQLVPKYKAIADSSTKDILSQQNEMQLNYKPSILNQEIALEQIAKSDTTAARTVLFVTILFIFIEMAPMVLKLLTNAGAYENRVHQIEAGYSTEDRLKRALDVEEYKSNRGLVRHLARSQRSIISTALRGWNEDQLNKMKDDPGYYNDLFNNNHDHDNQ